MTNVLWIVLFILAANSILHTALCRQAVTISSDDEKIAFFVLNSQNCPSRSPMEH